MNRIRLSITGIFFLAASGCVVTQDLLRERDALPAEYYGIATKMVARAKQTCIKVTGNNSKSKDEWDKGIKLNSNDWAIRRFYTSATDWYKGTAMTQGIIDNIYYNKTTQKLVCGDHQWGKYADSASITFTEYGKVEKRLNANTATAAPSTQPKSSAELSTEDTKTLCEAMEIIFRQKDNKLISNSGAAASLAMLDLQERYSEESIGLALIKKCNITINQK